VPPQPNPRASWPSHDDNGGFFLVISVVGIAVLAVVAWMNWHDAISSAVMALHHYEIGLLQYFTDRYDQADAQMAAADPEFVGVRDLYGIARAVGQSFLIPAVAFMLTLAGVCMWRAAPSRYKRAFDLDGLVREQARTFPAAAAFARRHLGLVAPARDVRPLDLALLPEEWAERHARRKDGSFDETAARRALALQLGPPWRGIGHAAPPVRAAFAVFALHRMERRREAQQLLGSLSEALAAAGKDKPEGPAVSLTLPRAAIRAVDAVLGEADAAVPAAAVCARHAYTHTALMALLNEARRKAGVLAPAQFVWLKLVDRPLWYALHSLGFETEGFGRHLHPNPCIEAAGARDHWAAERVAARALVEPETARALDAVRYALRSRTQAPRE